MVIHHLNGGFQINEADTLARQLEPLGAAPTDVRHVVLLPPGASAAPSPDEAARR